MDALKAIYVASRSVETLEMILARKDLGRQQHDGAIRITLEELKKLFAEVKKTNPVLEPSLSLADRVMLEKLGPDALKPPADAGLDDH